MAFPPRAAKPVLPLDQDVGTHGALERGRELLDHGQIRGQLGEVEVRES